MKTFPPFDPENLTEAQWVALTAFSAPLAMALKVGIPTEAIVKHVTGVLEKTKKRVPDLK